MIKILFVSSGNNKFGISPIVYNQGESIKKYDIHIDYFTIVGKGIFGYLKNVFLIRNKINNKYDIIHAHYSLSALATTLASPNIPFVVSLMGTDSRMNIFWRMLIKICYLAFWDHTIVKSKSMKESLHLNKASVIPNGVNLEKFELRDKLEMRKKLGLLENNKYILFFSNPERPEKNFSLAKNAVNNLKDDSIILLPIFDKKHSEAIEYLYASDILLMTSLWEGSPNAIKEAMACNLPIVSTDVGDVKWLIDGVDGCYLTSFDPNDVAEKIKLSLNFSDKVGRTKGRERIIQLGLDSDTIAKKIIEVYNSVIKND
ncbi:glycosyl transferase group 1 [Caldithrix abyssi DSM 13497]|uniref:Glycosyl transferase group 1 n=1 Tax=Caldithrix abyssi DSM 13497 TaxID=880073 RepID=H1XRP7_CALAY|nr:glycosyltransferase family 4 protein [Caldithrix abyssi]APF20139.1 Glycosyltransferase involved in cell wall bisynthesis [Caldithrix abyssi DSM 13497]EHO40200.1 glycosyl transferase group 1 [Caldithrix abyssi DSM 13497]